MDYEIENIFNLREWILVEEKPYRVYISKKDKEIGIIRGGIGKVNAAACAQYLLSRYSPLRIINLGVVGCINKKIKIGEIRKISECRFFDVDVTAFGYALGQIPKCEIVNYSLSNNSKINLPVARDISGDSFVTNKSKLTKIIKVFQPDFLDMELAAIAHVLYINNQLNILESYKAPSDYMDASATKDFYKNEKIAFQNLKKLAAKL